MVARSATMTSPVHWPDAGGPPRSRRYGDLYFSASDGLAESRAVFLAGCGLPAAWLGRRRFTIAELGFGTGLNIAALIDLWRREGPKDAWLSIFTIEAEPMPADDARRALAAWPELDPIAESLLARWPGQARGFHRLDLPEFRATLDVAVLEAAEALAEWTGAAHAWFLDGFTPSLNPQMWRAEVLDFIAALSAPGARLATYSAAGEVRRGLAAAGFDVARAPGFGGKRHRLEARWPGAAPADPSPPRVAIVGAGISGASLFRAFAAQGIEASVIASGAPAASTGPAALVTPRLDAGLAAPAAFFARAYARAQSLYEPFNIGRGALQLAVGPKDERRFAAIAASDLFDPGEMTLFSAAEAAAGLGEPSPPALSMNSALVVDPAPLLEVPQVHGEIARLERAGEAWRLLDPEGRLLGEAEVVVVAAGMASTRLVPSLNRLLRPVRGQASFAPGASIPGAVLYGGYAVPAPGGVAFGATHDRYDDALETREADHWRNLAALAAVLPGLAATLQDRPLEARTGVRATTRDYLPLAGAVDGLLVLTGLGSRGFALAPLLADHVVSLALGRPSPLAKSHQALVDPKRPSLSGRPGSPAPA
jgi:tRNA 5-methylaminomethyl-2-thiouridine biosynthesis bifunctional protein